MLFTFFLIDKPGSLAQRMEIRPEHKAYLGAKAEQIAFAARCPTTARPWSAACW